MKPNIKTKIIGLSWGSKNAEDMFRVAVLCANFDPYHLMALITKRQRDTTKQVNERTVLACMQIMKDNQKETP